MKYLFPLFIAAVTLVACGKKDAPPAAPAAEPVAKVAEPVAPALPAFSEDMLKLFGSVPAVIASEKNPVTEEKVTLGRTLWFEKRMSKNQDVSCDSCHTLTNYGVDGLPTSTGHKQQKGGRNSPTVYFAAGHLAQFWDGRSPDVEDQAKGPVLNPVEMAMKDAAAVETVLRSIPEYKVLFEKAFPPAAPGTEVVTFDNAALAIAVFERKLVTPSRFDKFLAGDKTALTADEQVGLATFVQTGCTGCHSGAYVGGGQYRKLGEVKPWTGDQDEGRAGVTKNAAEKQLFKVPSLRNIEKTGPYFHTGGVTKLEEAVKLMAFHQLGKDIDEATVARIVTFLKTLTGELPASYIQAPNPLPNGPATPAPDPA